MDYKIILAAGAVLACSNIARAADIVVMSTQPPSSLTKDSSPNLRK
ncbi:MAG: hypothetical protein JO254_02860 [Pseudolabrys sp.]|nr:hypothetical protein [Pseudolabrys sp.]